jgi:hypothetical protein
MNVSFPARLETLWSTSQVWSELDRTAGVRPLLCEFFNNLLRSMGGWCGMRLTTPFRRNGKYL